MRVFAFQASTFLFSPHLSHIRHLTNPITRRFKMTFPSLPLTPSSSNAKVPQLGLGTWKSEPGVVAKVVESAIRLGYRSIDCACDYGNEHEVGEGIASAMKSLNLPREQLFITSKLWNTYHHPEHVKPALQRTLSDLKIDYIDLYMIHFPISLKYVPFEKRYPPEWVHDPSDPSQDHLIPDPVPLAATWSALEACVDQGLIRHLGVCNFPVALLKDLLSYARIRPAMLQVELHPFLQQPKLLEFCKREDVAVTAFSPFGAASYVSLGMDKGDNLFKEPVLEKIAKKYDRTIAQVLLRWAIERGIAVIPKTSKEERLKENMDIFNFSLDDDDMKEIAELDKGRRYNDPGEFCVGMGMSIPIYD